MGKVIKVPGLDSPHLGIPQAQLAEQLCDRIKALVYEYSDYMLLCTAIGVLEIAKQEIIDAQS